MPKLTERIQHDRLGEQTEFRDWTPLVCLQPQFRMLLWAEIEVASRIEQDIARIKGNLFGLFIRKRGGIHDDRLFLLGNELAHGQNPQSVRKHCSEFRVPFEHGDAGDRFGGSYFVISCRIAFHVLQEIVHAVRDHRSIRDVAPIGFALWPFGVSRINDLFARPFKVRIANFQFDAVAVSHAWLDIKIKVSEQQQPAIGSQTLFDIRNSHSAATAAARFPHGRLHTSHHGVGVVTRHHLLSHLPQIVLACRQATSSDLWLGLKLGLLILLNQLLLQLEFAFHFLRLQLKVPHVGMRGMVTPVLQNSVRQRHRNDRVGDSRLNGVQFKIGSFVQHFKCRINIDGLPFTRPRVRTSHSRLSLQHEVEQLEHQPCVGSSRIEGTLILLDLLPKWEHAANSNISNASRRNLTTATSSSS